MINIGNLAVQITMSTNATQVLQTMITQLTGAHIAAGTLQTSLGKVATAVTGLGSMFVGWEVLKGLNSAVEAAEKLNHELVKLQITGKLTDDQAQSSAIDAFRIARAVPGSTADEITKMRKELFGVFGNMDDANETIEDVTRGSMSVARFVDKDTDLAQLAVKALELRGHITKDGKVDRAEFSTEFDALVRSIAASGALIDPQKLFMFIRQAGPAARGMDATSMWGMAPAVMNALGAGPAGTAMFSMFSQMIGHAIPSERVAKAMVEAGFLKAGSWQVGKGGRITVDDDGTPDEKTLTEKPFVWLHDRLEALKAKHGTEEAGKILGDLTEEQIKQAGTEAMFGTTRDIFKTSARSTSARLMNDVLNNWPVIQNEAKRFENMPGAQAMADAQNDKDLSVNLKNLEAAWTNFKEALGGPGVPGEIAILQSLTTGLNALQAVLLAGNGKGAETLFYFAAIAGSLTILGGALRVIKVTWWPFVAGVRAIAAVSGMSAAGLGLSSIAAGVSALAGIITGPAGLAVLAAFVAWKALHIGGTNEGEKDTPGYKDRFGNEDPNIGRPGVLPPSSNGTGKRSGDVYLDKTKVGMILDGYTADQLSRPPTGSSGTDYRVSPLMPGMSPSAFG